MKHNDIARTQKVVEKFSRKNNKHSHVIKDENVYNLHFLKSM